MKGFLVNGQFIEGDELRIKYQEQAGKVFYVSPTGSDTAKGTAAEPWKTLGAALSKTPANQGYTIKLLPGVYVESNYLQVPLGVSIDGSGADVTIIKGASSLYYTNTDNGFGLDKFLINLISPGNIDGNQRLSNFSVDGDGKKLHGGIYIRSRNKVVVENVKVQNTNYGGMWLWNVKDSVLRNSKLLNCSWGFTGYCSGALNLGDLQRVEIDNIDIDEGRGYGIKAMGPPDPFFLSDLKIHDSRVSVNPVGLWNNGQAPNIAIEFCFGNLLNSEIYNCYVDNTISIVGSASPLPSTGKQTVRIYNNVLDMNTRAKGAGYGIELSTHDVEIDHNYFDGGNNGIANWAPHVIHNWDIHHNVFYRLAWQWPGEVVRTQKAGIDNVTFRNNTVEMIGASTVNVFGLYGGQSARISLLNNLLINGNTSYNHWPNKLIHIDPAAPQTINGLEVRNNFLEKLPIGNIPGTYVGNTASGDPMITKTGKRPDPYYKPLVGSPLIGRGIGAIT